MNRCRQTLLMTAVCVFVITHVVMAADTTIHNIRAGQHEGFTRLVFDSAGARPQKIGPVDAGELTLVFEQINPPPDPARLAQRAGGAISAIEYRGTGSGAVIAVKLKDRDTEIRKFFLPGKLPGKNGYRLVLDFYPGGSSDSAAGMLVPVTTTATSVAAAPAAQSNANAVLPQSSTANSTQNSEPAATSATAAQAAESTTVEPEEDSEEYSPQTNSFVSKFSGNISIVGRSASIDGNDAKAQEYRDLDSPVVGEIDAKFEEPEKYFFKIKGNQIGADDVFIGGEAGSYGNFKIGASYDQLPHNFADDARTLYQGVGSSNLQINDSLQQAVENEPTSAGKASLLQNAYLTGSTTGDPDISRDTFKLDFDFVRLDPLNLRAEFGYVTQDGSRPFFGTFGTNSTVEIFEPIDNETLDIKVIGEYAKPDYLLNATYNFQDFNNNKDTLTFDNPLQLTEGIGQPSKGQIDLAPDNYFHNFSISGAYMSLPGNGRVAANAAWGFMRQDDDFAPFTVNSALTNPVNYSDPATLPAGSADAKVNTALYHLSLNLRPTNWLRLKGFARYYDYDNKTDQIQFSNGYVETDAFPDLPSLPTPIQNQPTDYTKTTADMDVGFDVWRQTRLNLGYRYEKTDRTNREVDNQSDNIFRGSIDTSPVPWGNFRLAAERMQRDIDDYDTNVYLESGQDLDNLPGLRKYDQADLTRNRVQLVGNFYPVDPLSLSGSFTYGKDDFRNSDYGLTKDDHYIFSIDGSYSLADRMNLNAFYTYEYYDNEQLARGSYLGPTTDWKAEGEDTSNTIGGGFEWMLIRDKLQWDLSYAYSEVDGKIKFSVPGTSVSDFDDVDDTTRHVLNTSLKYYIGKGFFFTLGYLYEKFEYDDFNTQGNPFPCTRPFQSIKREKPA